MESCLLKIMNVDLVGLWECVGLRRVHYEMDLTSLIIRLALHGLSLS